MLLDDIIELATDNKQSITVLLRTCVILAHSLKNEPLKAWANKELNGYGVDDELPPYRMLKANAKGHFSGYGGGQLRNWQIAPAVLEAEHRHWATETPLAHSIGTYEDLSKNKPNATLESPWDPNLVLYYQTRLPIKGYFLTSAWQDISTSDIVGVLDKVRNRVLNMALELRSEIGKADADLEKITPQLKAKVEQTIVNNIYGGTVYVAGSGSVMNATTIGEQIIVQGDWNQLASALNGVGINEPELKELQEAIASDGDTKLEESGKVMKWVKEKASKTVVGGFKVGMEVGKPLLTAYLMQHFGLS